MTDVDSELRQVSSTTTSVTDVDYYPHSISDVRTGEADVGKETEEPQKQGEKEKDVENANEPTMTAHQHELAQDEAIDSTPFGVKPFQLAHMLDPKSLDTLIAIGGINGLLRSLGTNAEHGLSSKDALHEKGKLGAGLGASHRHESQETKQRHSVDLNEKVPNIVLTEPSGKLASPTDSDDDSPAYHATLDDRRRVFGENVLPRRITKTLLQLMWLAMKDKVLVRLFFPAFPSSHFRLVDFACNRCDYFLSFGILSGFWYTPASR
jgi:Ca2+-transporting ATPase